MPIRTELPTNETIKTPIEYLEILKKIKKDAMDMAYNTLGDTPDHRELIRTIAKFKDLLADKHNSDPILTNLFKATQYSAGIPKNLNELHTTRIGNYPANVDSYKILADRGLSYDLGSNLAFMEATYLVKKGEEQEILTIITDLKPFVHPGQGGISRQIEDVQDIDRIGKLVGYIRENPDAKIEGVLYFGNKVPEFNQE
jgi:hypothetical protein